MLHWETFEIKSLTLTVTNEGKFNTAWNCEFHGMEQWHCNLCLCITWLNLYSCHIQHIGGSNFCWFWDFFCMLVSNSLEQEDWIASCIIIILWKSIVLRGKALILTWTQELKGIKLMFRNNTLNWSWTKFSWHIRGSEKCYSEVHF